MKRSLEILDEKLEYEPAQPFWRTHPKLQERIATADELLKNGSSNLPRAANPSGVIVGHAIVRAGGTVAGDMSAEALQRDDETRQVAVRLRKKYDSIGVQMLKKPGGCRKGALYAR